MKQRPENIGDQDSAVTLLLGLSLLENETTVAVKKLFDSKKQVFLLYGWDSTCFFLNFKRG